MSNIQAMTEAVDECARAMGAGRRRISGTWPECGGANDPDMPTSFE